MLKKVIVVLTIFSLLFSFFPVHAIFYSENGKTSVVGGIEEKVLFSQDFENTGVNIGSTMPDLVGEAAGNTNAAVLSDELVRNGSNSAKIVSKRAGRHAGKIFTDLTASTTPKFINGLNYTASLWVYYKPVNPNTEKAEAEFKWINGTGTTFLVNITKIEIPTNEWVQLSADYLFNENTVGSNVITLRYDVMDAQTDDICYIDDVKITYNDYVYETKQVPWISYEDFEYSPVVSSSTTPNCIVGGAGDSGTSVTRAVTKFDNAKSADYVVGISNRSTAYKSGKIVAGSSAGLKFYNFFNLDKRTPLTPEGITEWGEGWEMFTEEDIGKEYEISLWAYADSSGGAFPYGNTQEEIDGYIANIDVNDESTKPSITVGLYGPSNSTTYDSQKYEYASTPYKKISKQINWDEWTEFVLHYKVTNDTIYGLNSSNNNTLINAIRVCSSGGGSAYYPGTFYVDDVKVRQVNIEPYFALVSENQILTDVYISDEVLSDLDENAVFIGCVYDADKSELIDTSIIEINSTNRFVSTFNVDFSKDMIFKVFLWNRKNLSPISTRAMYEIPSYDELLEKIEINRIAQTFYNDVYTQKAFNWYTTNLHASHISYVEKTSEVPNWSEANYVLATANTDHFGDFFQFVSSRQRVVLTDLKPNTKYFYRVGNKDFDVWSNVYTFETANNQTTDAQFFMATDPQASQYSTAIVNARVLTHMLENYPDSEFLLGAGDLIIDALDEAQWITTFDVNSFATPNLTTIIAPGDHDTLAGVPTEKLNDETGFAKHFNLPTPNDIAQNMTYYSVDYKDMHIAVLDTNKMPYTVSEDDDQMVWLKNDMANTDKKWKIVVMHEEPQKMGGDNYNPNNGSERRRLSLQPIFTKCGIDLVVGGDSHYYTRTYPFKNSVENTDPNIIKTQTINGRLTKFFDPAEGVMYMTMGSVSSSTGGYGNFNTVYDVVFQETGCTPKDLSNVATYYIANVIGDDIIISAYHYYPETDSSILFDQFGLTKTS